MLSIKGQRTNQQLASVCVTFGRKAVLIYLTSIQLISFCQVSDHGAIFGHANSILLIICDLKSSNAQLKNRIFFSNWVIVVSSSGFISQNIGNVCHSRSLYASWSIILVFGSLL